MNEIKHHDVIDLFSRRAPECTWAPCSSRYCFYVGHYFFDNEDGLYRMHSTLESLRCFDPSPPNELFLSNEIA